MSGSTISTSETKLEAFKIQSSVYGATIPLVYGVTRVAGNLIWYNGFKAIPSVSTASAGGKGGDVTTENTTYRYEAAIIMALAEGEASGVSQIWRGKKLYSGGPTAAQVITATTSYLIPGIGGTVTLVPPSSGVFTAGLRVLVPGTLQGDATIDDWYLAAGTDYTQTGPVYVFPATYGGTTVTIEYQYLVASVVQTSLQQLGLSLAAGPVGQAVWSFLSASYPSQAVSYSGITYVYSSAYDLGPDAAVDNHNFEIQAKFAYHLGTSVPDVDASVVGFDVLSNARYGAGFPAIRTGSSGPWSDYCRAAGFLLSPALVEQRAAAEFLLDLTKLTNTGIVWSEGILKFVPYGDVALTGNGATYTPNLTPEYDLNDGVYTDKENPVRVKRKPQVDAHNHIRVEFLNRASAYSIEIAEAKDQANIDVYGIRSAETVRAHWICDGAVARRVAQMILQRSLYIRNTYEFKLPWHYVRLEPMDLVTITESRLRLTLLPVRITKVSEADDGELSFEAEDFPLGVANTSTYGSQVGAGFQHNYNVSPGQVIAPAIFEAPAFDTLTGLRLYVAVRGDGANWGGCQVWMSIGGATYRRMGTVNSRARYGVLSAAAAAAAASIAVSGCGGSTDPLVSGSASDAAALRTLCYVGGANPEYFAYQTATLTGTGAYTLSTLTHGAYGSPALAHASGDTFIRVDENIFQTEDLDPSVVGSTVRFKFCSFNVFGGALEPLSAATEYAYVIAGNGIRLKPPITTSQLTTEAATKTHFATAGSGSASVGGSGGSSFVVTQSYTYVNDTGRPVKVQLDASVLNLYLSSGSASNATDQIGAQWEYLVNGVSIGYQLIAAGDFGNPPDVNNKLSGPNFYEYTLQPGDTALIRVVGFVSTASTAATCSWERTSLRVSVVKV